MLEIKKLKSHGVPESRRFFCGIYVEEPTFLINKIKITNTIEVFYKVNLSVQLWVTYFSLCKDITLSFIRYRKKVFVHLMGYVYVVCTFECFF